MITGSVNGQTLTVMTPLVAADSVNYITCAFAFSDDWDDLDKYVHFAKGEASYSALIADDGTVGEMAHINLPAGVWDMYVHGEAVADDSVIKRVTTNIFKLRVERTGMTGGEPFPEITPSIGEQIIAQATAQADRAEGFADSAETDAYTASAYASSAFEYSQTATTKAGEAASSADSASASAYSALASASTAGTAAQTATAKAGEASESASSAETSADTATTKAGEAASSASTAETAAQTATTKAGEAASSATSAETAAQTTTTKAGEAASSASSAATSAQTATTKAGEAASSASSAATSAQTATTKAGEAASSASTAETAAQTATTKASEAASSTSSAATSAQTATTKASEAASSASSAETAAQTATAKAGEASESASSASASAASASAASVNPPRIGTSGTWEVWIQAQGGYVDTTLPSRGAGIVSIVFSRTDAQGGNVYTVTLTDGDTYEFTAPKGAQGIQGIQGERGIQGVQGERGIQGIQGVQGERGLQGVQGEQGIQGETGVGISSIVFARTDSQGGNVYTVTLTDGSTYEITAPKGATGPGSGDMLASDYDADSAVADAGGIAAYVESQLPTVPTMLSELSQDETHRVVTDSEKSTWNGKQDAIPANTYDAYGAASAVQGNLTSHIDDTVKHVTAAERSAWNAKGTYSKPSGGIPKSDLATAVQTSLGLADTALQSFTETDPVFAQSVAHGISSSDISNWNGKGTYSKPSTGIPKTDLASAVQTSLGLADSALQSYTETDPTVPSWAKQSSKPSYTASEVGALPDTTSIPTALSDLSDDATHRTVTDTEKSTWNGKGTYSKPSGGIPDSDIASAATWNGKENKGKITIGGVEKTASSHTVTIVTNGVTTNLILVGVS